MSTLPNTRASIAEKHGEKWYKQMADWVIELALASNDKSFTSKCLDAANGVINKEDYEYVLGTYITGKEATEAENQLNAQVLGKLRDVDILTPIKEKYMGEFISSYHNYQVYSLDPEVILRRNADLGEQVKAMMFQKVSEILANPDKGSDLDISGFIKKFLDEWIDKDVAAEQDTLEMLNANIEAKRKYIDAYFYWWACEEVYTYRYLSGKDVKFKVLNPLEYYRVRSGNYFVEDDNYGLHRTLVSIQEIIDEFYNNMDDGLNEEQLSLLKAISVNIQNGVGYVNSRIFLDYRKQFPTDAKLEADIQVTRSGLNVTKDHYVFKTEIKKGILSYYDNDGSLAGMDVDEDYILNKKAGDVSIEWLYINQMWEGWRFGGDFVKLYIPPRPVQIQRELLSNSSVCKSPFNGASYIHEANAVKPIPYRIKDNLALYKIYTLLEERWINKFKSWLMVPESILADSKEMKTEERLDQADIDSIFPFNDENLRDNPNGLSNFREVATTAVIKYITILNQVKQSIKQDAWELANMNDARRGQNNPYKGKGTNEQEYAQAITGTIWSLEMFNSFREKDYMANLDFSRVAWVDGKQGSYIDENTKQLKLVNVDGEAHLGTNVGVFISNSAELNAQAEALKQLAFSTGQNNDPELSAEAITNKNISKLKLAIGASTKARREFDMKMETAKADINRQAEELRIMNDRETRDHEITIKTMELDSAFDIAVLESDTELEINRARLEVDLNGNGFIDKDEANLANPEVEVARNRAASILADRQIALKQMSLGAKKIREENMKLKQANKPKSK